MNGVLIKGTKYHYVTTEGKVYNVTRTITRSDGKTKVFQGRTLKTRQNPLYELVTLRETAVLKHRYVHRLVAQAFIPNPKNKPQVNHKDGNKLNNHVSNLEWATGGENQRHAYKTGLKRSGVDHNFGKHSDEVVKTIRSLYATGKYQQKEVAWLMGCNAQYVQKIVTGIRRKYV